MLGLERAMDDTFHNILAWQWKQMNTGKLVVINYSAGPAQAHLSLKGIKGEITEEFSGNTITITPEMVSQGATLQLLPYESKIFTYTV